MVAAKKTDPAKKARRKAMRALSRLYTAGLLTGIRSWVEWADYASDYAASYYPRFTDRDSDAQENKWEEKQWREALEEDHRSYMNRIDNILDAAKKDYDAKFDQILKDELKDPPAAAAPAGAAPRKPTT